MHTSSGTSRAGPPGIAAPDPEGVGGAAEGAPAGSPPPREAAASRRFPLTPLQKGLLAESMVASDRGANVEQIVWELDNVPDPDRFRAAWQAAVDAYEALRLSFVWEESRAEPHQTVLSSVRLPFARVDAPEQTVSQQQARLERFLEEDRRAGFDLRSAPLMRVSLLVFAESRAVCVWTIHHTIIDGNCYATVLQRVLKAWSSAPDGRGRAPSRAGPQFTDFLRWLESYDATPGTRHFAELLDGFDVPTPLPLQDTEAAVRTAASRSSQTTFRLEPRDAEMLRSVARDTGSTPNTLVQLAWALLLARYSGEDDVVFGATWAARGGGLEDAAHVVGPLINTLPVRVRLDPAKTVREAIVSLRSQHLAMRPFLQTSAGRIKAATALARSAHLFPTIVLFENARFYSLLQAEDERWRRHRLWSRSQANVPLVLAAWFDEGTLVLELEYDLGLYTEADARRVLADYARVLSGIAESLGRSPLCVPMLDEALRAALTTEEVARELVPISPSAIERVLHRASLAPTAVAVQELGGNGVTYAELERRVRGLAAVLQSEGVVPGSFVAVLLSRSIDAVVALLAVQAAGAAFVPLDPADPLQRLEFMVRDSGARRVLVSRETRGRLRGARHLELEVGAAAPSKRGGEPRPLAVKLPTDPAYLIYTSGTTGEPKGVCVAHGALANHVAAIIDRFALAPGDRVLQFAQLTFDVSLEEVMPTLAAGSTLVLRDDALASSARAFFASVAAEELTVLNLPTSFWHQLVHADRVWPSSVRLVVVGGEQASPQALRKFRASRTGHIRWINAYGPTEAAITSTCYDDAERDHTADFVPIGRPLPGVSHFVLDRHMRLTVPGQPGQLHIGGAGLALGYLGRDAITAARFVEHPFLRGARLYATGDRVRRTESGNYVYLGRIDNQVKVRGHRVELGGIEARLRQHPAVREAAVVVRQRGAEDGALVGFVVADRFAVSPAQLREHLEATLPAYMVPLRLAVVPELPRLASGKIDRRALAALDLEDCAEAEHSAAVGDALVRSLLQIWSLLLGTPVRDTSASFFDLGGDSLLVVQMFTEIELRLGKTCDAPAFLRNPTLSNLATLLRAATNESWSAPLMELAHGDRGVRPLFLAPGLSGRGLDYVHLAESLSGGVPVYALQAPVPAKSGVRYDTLRELATYFVARMREAQPRGPYAVAGFSAAGVVAMAIAEELRACGECTDFVGVFDSVPPRSVPVPSPFSSPRRLARLSRTAVSRVREVLGGPDSLGTLFERISAALVRGLSRWNALPERYELRAREAFAGGASRLENGEREAGRHYFDAIWNHEFGELSVDIVLFRVALDPFEGPHEQELGWQRVTSGEIAVEYLRGAHDDLLTAHGARELALRLEPYLRRRAPS